MTKNKKGFTIIEVVLVLAIAGLIFLMVFIALPALQRGQRNTQREDDISRFLTAANDFQTNNNGKTPFLGATDGAGNAKVNAKYVPRYIDNDCVSGSNGEYTNCGSEFTDPDGTIYKMSHYGVPEFPTDGKAKDVIGNTKWADAGHIVRVYTNSSCGDEGEAVKGNGIRQYAMFYVLEGDSVTCNDNH